MSNTNRIIAQDGVIELNGQFFLQQQDRAQSEFQHLTGEKSIAPEAVGVFAQNVRLSAAYCAAADIPYLHVVYPSKAMAFREDFAAAGVPLVGIFGDAHRVDKVIYPLDTLVGEEDFETHGSHCTELGYLKIARIAFRAIGVPIDAYRPILTTRLRECDLAKMRGLPKQKLVAIRGFEGLKSRVKVFSNAEMLPGNRGRVMYTLNELAPIQSRVLLFGDSFFGGSIRTLAPLFQELIYLRAPYVMEDVAQVLEPDMILTSNTERYLVNVPDKTRDQPYFTKFMLPGVDSNRMKKRDREALLAVFSGRESTAFKDWRTEVNRRKGNLTDRLARRAARKAARAGTGSKAKT